jgi:hypothetical protein
VLPSPLATISTNPSPEQTHLHLLRKFAPYYNGVPRERWLHALVNRIDPQTFASCFEDWIHDSCMREMPPLQGVMLASLAMLGANRVVRAKVEALDCASDQIPDLVSHAAHSAERWVVTR